MAATHFWHNCLPIRCLHVFTEPHIISTKFFISFQCVKCSANVRGLQVTVGGGMKGSRDCVGYNTRARSGLPLTRGRANLVSQTLFPRVDGRGPSALPAMPINTGKRIWLARLGKGMLCVWAPGACILCMSCCKHTLLQITELSCVMG